MTRIRVPATLLALMAASACGGKPHDTAAGNDAASSSGGAVTITADARQQAQQIFSTRCAACHGLQGRGDGPGATSLVPRPRNYHNPAWQDSASDQEIENAIVYGGTAVGRSPAMVANPDLAGKPAIVAALREIVRNFGKEK